MLEKLQERILELAHSLEQVIAQHNYLSGAKQEAEKLLEAYIAHQNEINKIVEEIPTNPGAAVMDGLELAATFNDNNNAVVPAE